MSRKKPFNDAFGKLKGLAKAAGERAPKPSAAADRDSSRPPPPAPAAPEVTDEELWASAASGAAPLDDARGFVPRPSRSAPRAIVDDDLEAYDELVRLVKGEGTFDISDTDEFIEGRVAGLDSAIARRLRRGDYSVQGHIDLHGMTRAEARVAVQDFFRVSRERGKRCVLVVHGRGMHSKDQVPVLKEALGTWLRTARFAEHVLAFSTARPSDGGAGAIYVLLRRGKR